MTIRNDSTLAGTGDSRELPEGPEARYLFAPCWRRHDSRKA